MENEPNLLDEFFGIREETLVQNTNSDQEQFKIMLKNIQAKDLKTKIDELPSEYEVIKEILKDEVDELVTDYQIKLAYYNKKYYKQGFEDAVLLNCRCKEIEKNKS